MELLMPEMIDDATLVPLQKLMYRDLRVAARKLNGKPAWFVVVGDLVLKDKNKVSLFVAVRKEAEAKAWLLKLKERKPPVLAIGTCELTSKDMKHVQVTIDQVKGSRTPTLRAAKIAFKLDPVVRFVDANADGPDPSSAAPAKPAEREDVVIEPETVQAAASSLGVRADDIDSLIAEAHLSDSDMAALQELLADPKKLEAQMLRMFDDLVARGE
jgi:hypothetical protein